MAGRQISRTLSLDINKCVENVGGNRFELVLIASARAKELAYAHKKSESSEYMNAHIQAIIDIQEGKLGREYLAKYRRH